MKLKSIFEKLKGFVFDNKPSINSLFTLGTADSNDIIIPIPSEEQRLDLEEKGINFLDEVKRTFLEGIHTIENGGKMRYVTINCSKEKLEELHKLYPDIDIEKELVNRTIKNLEYLILVKP